MPSCIVCQCLCSKYVKHVIYEDCYIDKVDIIDLPKVINGDVKSIAVFLSY